MTIRELIQDYMDITDAIVTGKNNDWTVDTPEETLEGLTDWEMETLATDAIKRYEELEGC